MKPTSFLKWLKSLSVKSILLLSSGLVVLIATIVALSGTISSASKRMEKKLYGEEIGNIIKEMPEIFQQSGVQTRVAGDLKLKF